MAAHKPALGQRFKTVADAHQAVEDAMAAKAANIDAFNGSRRSSSAAMGSGRDLVVAHYALVRVIILLEKLPSVGV